jgi:tetratricopeptide (TPR) repeat protein
MNKIRIIVFLICIQCAWLIAQNPGELPKGKATEKVDCTTAPGFSYALYLPSAYSPEKTWPVLFIFDADAQGMVPLELFKSAAEKYGYIIVSSNNSASDDPTVPNLQAMLAMYNDATSRFSLNKLRMYAAGYSGGARIACDMAYRYSGQFAGVIGAGSGFPTDHDPTPDTPFAFFGTVGNLDFNYYEMRLLQPKLKAAGVPYRIRVFDGGHDWPPAEICTEELEWMEIQAMKSGKRDKNPVLIQEIFEKRLAKAEGLKNNRVLREARDEYQSIAVDFESLVNVDAVAAQSALLSESDEVKQWEQQEARRDQIDHDFRQKLASVNRRIRNTSENVPKLEDVLEFLQVADLKKKAKEAQLKEDRLQAQRLLTVVRIQHGFYLARSFKEYGDYARLALCYSVAAAIDPDQPNLWYGLARAQAQMGEKEKAMDSLRKAVDHGFKDADKLTNDFDLRSLQDEKQFKRMLERLRKQS